MKNSVEVVVSQDQKEELDNSVYELSLDDLTTNFGAFAFESTKELKKKSFASLQLRARNAVKSFFQDLESHLLLLCGSSLIDNTGTLKRLMLEVGHQDVPVILE